MPPVNFIFEDSDLNVDKVFEEDMIRQKSDEFDNLFHELQDKVEKQEDKEEEEVSDEDETFSSSEEEIDTEDEDGDETEDEVSTESIDGSDEIDVVASLEAFLSLHAESHQLMLAQESEFTSKLLNSTGQGLTYVKDLGFEYGPILFKHVYKGVVFALEKTLRALFVGSKQLAKLIQKRLNNFKVYKEKIAKLRDSLELLDQIEKEDQSSDGSEKYFRNEDVIEALRIGRSNDFDTNIHTLLSFYEAFTGVLGAKVKTQVASSKMLIKNVLRGNVTKPSTWMLDNPSFKGFSKKNIPDYKPVSETLDTYVYQNVLPGNILFMAHVPKLNLNEDSEITEACQNSQMFLGYHNNQENTEDYVTLIDRDKLKKFLDDLDSLCDVGLDQEHVYKNIIELRKSLKIDIRSYLKYLFDKKEKISIRDSMANFIALKVAYLDSTYIAGSMHVNDYVLRTISASMDYCKEAIGTYSKS